MRLLAFLILISLAGNPFNLFGQNAAAPDPIGQYIIQIQPGSSASAWLRQAQSTFPDLQATDLMVISESLRLYNLQLKGEGSQWLEMIRKMPLTRAAGMDAKLEYRTVEPNDPLYPEQWHLDKIKAPSVWEVNTGGKDVNGNEIVIAIVDEGFDTAHVDLRPNLFRNDGEIPLDGIDNDNNGYKDDFLGFNVITQNDQHNKVYHGTAVAGLCAAKGNNNQGISGVSWDSKILLLSGAGTVSQALMCYDYILNMRKKWNQTNGLEGIHIVLTNSSFGKDNAFPDAFPGWCEFYDAMGAAGILSVASTANNDTNVDEEGDMPTTCSSDYLLTVTNTTIADEKEEFAGYGLQNIDIGAPGEDVQSLSINNGYANFAGTSASAPVTTGAAALLFGIPAAGFGQLLKEHPEQAALKIKQAIIDGVDVIPSLQGRTVSNGRLNIFKALGKLQAEFGISGGDMKVVAIYPNMVRDQLNIIFQTNYYDEHEFLVVNLLGQVMMSQKFTPSRWENTAPSFDTDHLANGIYFLMIRRGNKADSSLFVKY